MENLETLGQRQCVQTLLGWQLNKSFLALLIDEETEAWGGQSCPRHRMLDLSF